MTDPKRSLRVPASRRPRLPSPPQRFFYPRLALLSASEFLVLSFCLPGFVSGTGDRSLFLPLQLPHPASDLLSPKAQESVAFQVSHPLQTFRSSQRVPDYRTANAEEDPAADCPRPPSPARPRAPPGCTPPAPPARTWSPWPAPPLPLPSTRVRAGAGVLNRVSRAQGAGPRAPYWPPWLPITRHSRPGPAQPLWSCYAAQGLGSPGQTFRGTRDPASVHHFPENIVPVIAGSESRDLGR